MTIKRVAGTRDILPEECIFWQGIEEASRKVFSLYNYKELRTPVIEESDLFNRSLGESTEIVQKQMFLIRNKEETYALRPEGTASLVRAYIENNLDKTGNFAKFYYIGPMFRLERPQKGRLRQFHHIGCEVIGAFGPDIDIEIISLADSLLKTYGIQGYQIKLNSLGCPLDKERLSKFLKDSLQEKLAELCADCRLRFDRNVFRILDCKEDSCRKIVKELAIGDSHLCPDCQEHFFAVKNGLDILGLNYEVDAHLARGLDYYTRTVFEIKHSGLGSQDAIGAGGRYDNLVAQLGGPQSPAIGFAFGVERLLLAVSRQSSVVSQKLVYLITLGGEARREGLKLLQELRKAGITADTDYEGKTLKVAMRKANDLSACFAVILGDDELKKNVVTLKDMQSGAQREVKIIDLINELNIEPRTSNLK